MRRLFCIAVVYSPLGLMAWLDSAVVLPHDLRVLLWWVVCMWVGVVTVAAFYVLGEE